MQKSPHEIGLMRGGLDVASCVEAWMWPHAWRPGCGLMLGGLWPHAWRPGCGLMRGGLDVG